MDTKKKRNGLYIELPDDLDTAVRVYAAQHKVKLKQIVIDCLRDTISKSEYQRSATSAAETLTDKPDPNPE
jgi:plasmid stability protein